MNLKSKLKEFKRKFVEKKRSDYLEKQRGRLKNTTPTIISRNCVGGIIYHDLGLKFNSPTINLSMDNNDFITFAENLDIFLKVDGVTFEEIRDSGLDYPVGKLSAQGKSVIIQFVHYKTLEQARLKWVERVQRVDFNNLFLIWECSCESGPDDELWKRFLSLGYRKILITGQRFPVNNEYVFRTRLYGKKYHYGKILEYQKGLLFYKRYLDKFDYVEFLNEDN